MFPAYSVGDASRPAPPPPPPSALRGGASASSPRLRRLLSVACVAVALLAVLCSSAAHPAAVLLRRACADAINAALVAVLGIVSLAWSLLGLVVIAPCRAAFAIATGAAEPSYAGQVVLVTGASSGIGEAIALRICRLAGAQSDRQDAQKAAAGLVLVARRGDRLAELQRRCGDLSGGRVRALAVVADVAIEADGARMVHAAVSEFGRLDLVILNAGIPGPHARLDQLGAASERFHELMNVNFFGQVWPTLFAIPHLKASRGAIVVVSSMYGLLTAPYQTAYSASKHALSGFFDSLRPELAAHGVSITLHHPGGVATEVTSKFTDARGARSSLDLPAAFMASADACAQSVLEAAGVRAADEAFPFYVRAFASVRAASPTLFDAWFFRLNEFYFDAGIMQLKQTATP